MAAQEENGHPNGHVKHSESNGHPTKNGQELKPEPCFVGRVASIPIVQDSVGAVSGYAHQSSLGRLALTTATSTLTTVSRYTPHQPEYVQAYYEKYVLPHLERADQLGCRSLDLLESKVPFITQPTAEIVKAVKAPPAHVMDVVKDKVDHTLTLVRTPAEQAAREANKRLGVVVDNVEAVLERYLPPADNEKTRDVVSDNQAVRAYQVLHQASQRLSQRVSSEIAALPLRGREDVARLSNAVAAHLQALQAAVTQSVIVYSQAAQDRLLPDAVKERLQHLHAATAERLQRLTTHLSAQLHRLVDAIKAHAPETPEWVTARLQSLATIANQQMELVRAEYARTDISTRDKAAHVAQALQDQVLPVLQTLHAQALHYSSVAYQKAQHDLKYPLEYLGLAHAVPKAA